MQIVDRMESKPELRYIFTNINELLRFGEAKHAGLTLLNSGIILGICSSYNNIGGYMEKWALIVSLICLGLSIAVSIASQYPVTEKQNLTTKLNPNFNIYFYKDLANMDESLLVLELQKTDSAFNPTPLEKDLIIQILNNARIANQKFNYFKYAGMCTTFGAGLLAATTFVKIIWHL